MRKAKLLENAAPLTTKAHVEWFHGSPEKIKILRPGSTVTPIITDLSFMIKLSLLSDFPDGTFVAILKLS